MDLSVFEAKALAQALTDHGHAVSERTVQRWKKGVTKPKPQDIRAIRQLLRLQSESAPQPQWATELEQRLAIEIRTNRQVVVALLEARAAADVKRADEIVEGPDEPPPAAPSPGTAAAKRAPVARRQGR